MHIYTDLYAYIYVHISPMRRGHAHLLCAIPTLTDDPTHVCIYMYVHVCICIYIYIYVRICMYLYIYIYICMYIYICVCTYAGFIELSTPPS